MIQPTAKDGAPEDSSLDKQSLLIVMPRFDKQFSLTVRQLGGAKRLSKGVYRIRANDPGVTALLKQYPHVSFRRVREVPRVSELEPENGVDPTYTIVTYRFDNPNPQQKKTAQRLTRRTPAVRLRSGVLLFPHLRTKDKIRYYKPKGNVQLYNAKMFVERMTMLGAKVLRFSRLRITGQTSMDIVNEAIEKMVEHELGSVERRIRMMLDLVDKPITPTKKMKQRYSELSRRLRILRTSYLVVQEIWDHDTEKSVKRTYNLLLRLRRELEMRIDIETSAAYADVS